MRTLLTRLTRGELDVGVVYASDLAAAGDSLEGRPLPGAVTTLVIGPTAGAPASARDLVAFVRSPTGSAILAEHGFGPAGEVAS